MNTFDLRLDLDKSSAIQVVTLRQGDIDGTTVSATVYDHGALADLSGISSAYIEFALPDGTHYYRGAATVSGSVVTALVDESQAASVPGRACNAYFSLSDGTHEYSTASFVVAILRDATSETTPAESYDDAIQDFIDAWLDEHPEATTTVQDGSITTAKLADGAVTDAKLAQTGGILTSFSNAIGNLYKSFSAPISNVLIQENINTNRGTIFHDVTNRARTNTINVTTSNRRAIQLADSTYMMQVLAYSAASISQANYIGKVTDTWVDSTTIVYLPYDVPVIACIFQKVDGTDFETDGGDAQAILSALTFYEVTDPTLSVQGAAADAKAVGDEIGRLDEALVHSLDAYTTSDGVSLVSTTAGVLALYDALVTAYPTYVSKAALTHGSLTLYEYTFTTGSYNRAGSRTRDAAIAKPVVLVCSGVHGYERSSVMSLYVICKALCDDLRLASELADGFTFKVVPIVCPYGYDNDSRTNEDGVNINRNFASTSWTQTATGDDYSGPSAGSEDETQVMQAWINANTDAALYIDWHNSNYLSEISCSLMVTTGAAAQPAKMAYLRSINPIIPYWEGVREIPSTSIFAYTGLSTATGSSVSYATDKGLLAMTLETSWNVNSSGKHSAFTIGVGAEAMGNMLVGMRKLIEGD